MIEVAQVVRNRALITCRRTPCKTPCQYKVYDLRSYIQDMMHVILDKSAQIGATLTFFADAPDLNPIEHLWQHPKWQLNAYEVPPAGIHELWDRVQMEWEILPKEVCRNLIESMPRRIEAVIKAKGPKPSTSQKIVPSRVPYCKIYIKAVALTKLLHFGVTREEMSSFVMGISHGFTFVIWAAICLTSEI